MKLKNIVIPVLIIVGIAALVFAYLSKRNQARIPLPQGKHCPPGQTYNPGKDPECLTVLPISGS